MIVCRKKIGKSFKMSLGLWLSSVNLIDFEFHDFLILIEPFFSFKLFLKINIFFASIVTWFESTCLTYIYF